MRNLVVRNYREAAFFLDRKSHKSLFFEGPLAPFAEKLLSDQNQLLPAWFLNEFNPEAKREILEDFKEMKVVIKSFLSPRVNDLSQDGSHRLCKKSALEELSSYAVKNWQVISANIEFTYLCNQCCVWCYLDNFSRRGLGREKLEDLANQLRQAGTIFTLFTGGEIFLRKDAIEIMRMFANHGFALEVKTNGTLLTPKLMNELATLDLFDLQISVYEIRTGKSLWTNSYYDFSRLSENLKYLTHLNLPLTVAVLVGKHNIDHLQEFHDRLQQTGVNEIFYSPYLTPCRSGDKRGMDLRLSSVEMEKKLTPFLEKIGAFTPQKEYRPSLGNDDPPCYAGQDQIAIDPSGTVFPCLDFRIPIGDLKNEPLQKILSRRKEVLDLFKLREISKCQTCPLIKNCDSCVGTALIENGDYKKPSQHKCDIVNFYHTHQP